MVEQPVIFKEEEIQLSIPEIGLVDGDWIIQPLVAPFVSIQFFNGIT